MARDLEKTVPRKLPPFACTRHDTTRHDSAFLHSLSPLFISIPFESESTLLIDTALIKLKLKHSHIPDAAFASALAIDIGKKEKVARGMHTGTELIHHLSFTSTIHHDYHYRSVRSQQLESATVACPVQGSCWYSVPG